MKQITGMMRKFGGLYVMYMSERLKLRWGKLLLDSGMQTFS
jgi:hypothetical protein